MRRLARLPAWMSSCALLAACAVAPADGEDPRDGHPLDREVVGDPNKGDTVLAQFHPSRIISDAAFEDVDSIGVEEVQTFFEETPYGVESFLANHLVTPEESFAEALVRIARAHEINPLLLLVTIQKETSLVAYEDVPSTWRLEHATGCGCHDRMGCMAYFRGTVAQLRCAAESLRAAFDAGTRREPTRSGYELGRSKAMLDSHEVTFSNRATLALYTYTPWTGAESRHGNWLFWSIWRRYSAALGYEAGFDYPHNEGWIGGACERHEDCFFDDAFCARRESSGGGFCTTTCTRFCPERTDAGFVRTFCVELDEGDEAGSCVARCQEGACGDSGRTCAPDVPRLGQPDIERDVCL